MPFAPYPSTKLPKRHLRVGREISRRIQVKAKQRPSPEALGNLALLHLLAGRQEKAIALLEQATALAPRNANLLSDLAAVYIARAGDGTRPFDLVRAVSLATRATEIDHRLPEAHFNRALAMQKLSLDTEARRDWIQALSNENDLGWHDEINARLQSLSRASAKAVWEAERTRLEEAAGRGDHNTVDLIVARFPQPARSFAEETLLAHWAKAMAAGRLVEAESRLLIARAIGASLMRRRGDAMVHDAIASIDAARSESSSQRLHHLIEGHRIYGAGLELYQSRDFRHALPELLLARQELRQGRTPFVHWAAIYLASCDYWRSDFEGAYTALSRLQADLPKDRYPSLEGRITWILGSIEMYRGRPGDALPRFYRGRAFFLRTGELEELSGMLQHLAIILRAIGDNEEAWKYTFEGLQLTRRLQSPRRVFAAFDEAGYALERDHPQIALCFQNELLDLARRVREPAMLAPAYLRRARSLLRMKKLEDSRHELAEARRYTAEIQEPSLREPLDAEILTVEAEISLSLDPAKAILRLNDAIRFYQTFGYRRYLPVMYFLRARAHMALGDERLAEDDYRAGLAEVEAVGESVADPRLRLVLQDQATALFDETMELLARQERAEDAFQVSESGRTRQLLEAIAGSISGHAQPARRENLVTMGQIRRELPTGTALVKYAALKDRLLVWSLSRERQSLHTVTVGRDELTALVERARKGLRAGGDRRSVPELRELHRWLIETGVVARGARELVFVPDKQLHFVPFAALVDPRGRYLVEESSIAVAPSANIYIQCLRRGRREQRQPPKTVLAIGVKEFDPLQFPWLQPLRHATREAQLIAASYPRALLLTEREATRTRFLAAMSEAPEVLHFASHAIANASSPDLSMLAFAPDPGKNASTAVYLHEVYKLRLDRTRLVVLSACNTATGKLSASEGVIGLARPFLAAGVPAVVASLGSIDDSQSPELMSMFHQQLRAGKPATEALRAAQLSRLVLQSEAAQPRHWAFFEIIGATPPAERR